MKFMRVADKSAPLVLSLGLCCCLEFAPSRLRAADHEQRQGPVTVRIRGGKVEAGQVNIRLSDQLEVTVVVEGKANLEVDAITRITPSKDWQVVRTSEPIRTALAGGRGRWEEMIVLEPMKPGDVPLPLAPVRYRESAENLWQEAAWKPVVVQVTTEVLSADLGELRDNIRPEDVPESPPWWRPFTWPGLVLLFLLLLVVSWRFIRLRDQQQPVLPPHESALRELDRISGQELATERAIEQFHTTVCDVIRKYLELRFYLPALEQTTAEFLDTMRHSPELTTPQQAMLRDFLERCDLVKFARVTPSTEACRELVTVARRFVEQSAVGGTISLLGSGKAITGRKPQPKPSDELPSIDAGIPMPLEREDSCE